MAPPAPRQRKRTSTSTSTRSTRPPKLHPDDLGRMVSPPESPTALQRFENQLQAIFVGAWTGLRARFTSTMSVAAGGDLARMFDWLVWAVACYAAVFMLRGADVLPQVQTVLWKLGNMTVAAYAGYWIDRRSSRKRINDDSPPLEQMRRAIVMAAAMLAVGLGL